MSPLTGTSIHPKNSNTVIHESIKLYINSASKLGQQDAANVLPHCLAIRE
jgi:hypothetical protein